MTESQPETPGAGLRILVALAALVIVVAGLQAAQAVLVPVLLAAFLAIISIPPLTWLHARGLPGWLSLAIVVGGGVLAVLVVAGLIGASVNEFSQKLPEYQERLEERTQEVFDRLKESGIGPAEQFEELEGFDAQKLLEFGGTVLGVVASLFSNVVLILLIYVFMLIEAAVLPAKLRAMPGYSSERGARFRQILENVRRYLAIKTQTSILTGVLVTLLLIVLGVDFPLLWGLLAFFFNFVPNIGSIIAAVPAVVVALVQLGPASAAYTATGYVAVNGLIGYVLEPRLMGRGLGLSTLVVFLSLIFWGAVLGPVGMFLSVPLTMIVRIALECTQETRWIAILLGSDAPPSGNDE